MDREGLDGAFELSGGYSVGPPDHVSLSSSDDEQPIAAGSSDARTEPIETIPIGDEEVEEIVLRDDSVYFFRYHVRDLLERLFVHRIGPRWYTFFVYTGLVLFIVPIIVMVVTLRLDLPFAWISMFVGTAVSFYPIGREIHRYLRRTRRLVRLEKGVLIEYAEPTSLFWGFTGDGDGDETFLEGSIERRIRIGFLNRIVFWGCGDLTIFGKVEGGKVSFENVPNVKHLQAFLSN
jgi:hypothetical protein